MENGKDIFNKILKLQFVTSPKSSKSEFAWKMQKFKKQKHSLVVNAIAHRAMFSKMQSFTLASLLRLLLSDLTDFLSRFFVSFIYPFLLLLHIQ